MAKATLCQVQDELQGPGPSEDMVGQRTGKFPPSLVRIILELLPLSRLGFSGGLLCSGQGFERDADLGAKDPHLAADLDADLGAKDPQRSWPLRL